MVFIGLVAYFLIMNAVGLGHNLELRALNIVIMGGGVLYSIKSIHKKIRISTTLKELAQECLLH